LGAHSGEGSWLDLATGSDTDELKNPLNQSTAIEGTRALLPLIYSCFNMIYDSDGAISRAAVKALKTLVTVSSERDERDRSPWVKLIETTYVPCLKAGITTKEISPRRSFVQLVSHLAMTFSDSQSVHLYGDLKCLIRDDDQEIDFFLNVTHVQLHRRAKAMSRLRKLLSRDEGSDQTPLFSDQSLSNILLPLAMHPVYEHKSKAEESYTVEAILAVGEIARHLPWSKYNSTLQSALQNLGTGRYPDQERYLIAMVVAIIDSFHFAVETGDNEKELPQSSQGNGVGW
jgi:U3 small nucleolar RNA-associated protein 20